MIRRRTISPFVIVVWPFGSLALAFVLEQQSLKQLIEWQLQTDKKLAEFGEPSAHAVETHLINNRLHFEDILSKQRDAPFPIIQAGCARNELPNSAGVLAPNATVPGHQLLAFIKGESIPIFLLPTAFAHGIKAEHRPIGKVRIEAVFQVFVHASGEFFYRTIVLVR